MWGRTWQWACREEHIPEPATTTSTTSAIARRSSCADPTDRSRHSTTPACTAAPSSSRRPRWATARSCAARSTGGRGTSTVNSSTSRASGTSRTSARGVPAAQIRTGLWGGFVFVNFDDCAPGTDGRAARGVPRRPAGPLRQLGSRRSLRRGPHPQEAAGELEGVGRGVPRGVSHPRNAQSVDLLGRRCQRAVRRVRRQRHPLHPHDRNAQPAPPAGEATRRADDAQHVDGPQEPRRRGADSPGG